MELAAVKPSLHVANIPHTELPNRRGEAEAPAVPLLSVDIEMTFAAKKAHFLHPPFC